MLRQPPDEDPAVDALRVLVRTFQTLPSDPRLREQLLHNPAAVIAWGLASTEQHQAWEQWLQQRPGVVERIFMRSSLDDPHPVHAKQADPSPRRLARKLVDRLALGKPLPGPGLVLSNPWRLQPPQHVRRRVRSLDVWRSSAEGERLLTLWLDHFQEDSGAANAIRDWLAPSVYARMQDLYPLWGGGGYE
jgi:hypothetical protein